jgi:hypothetical protein
METPVKIDKELYQKAYEGYRQWNVAEQVDRLYRARARPAGEGWKQYQALWHFFWQIGRTPSERQLEQNQADWVEYYRRIKIFEDWRASRGSTPKVCPENGHRMP